MKKPTVLMKVRLGMENTSTKRTRHYRDNIELPAPLLLSIVKYENDEGYYLLYLDSDGNELTDTYHASVEGAMAQAEFEFRVRPDQWERTD